MFTDNYIIRSLELHQFFARIMKEHALFLRAGFTPAAASFARQAEQFKTQFEQLLLQAVLLGEGLISQPVLRSGELVTEFTARAEAQTQRFTGIAINQGITARQLRMNIGSRRVSAQLRRQVRRLNQTALRLLDGLIAFKERILCQVLDCELFTMNYPLLIEHILREAKLYRDYVDCLECQGELCCRSMQDTECFWNQIMMEHAQFIRGLLDPTETELLCAAHDFSCEYEKLLESCRCAHEQTMTADALAETIRFRDFKAAGTQGIEQCRVRGLILPLLADHVLREANHYIRLLQC